MAQAADGAAQVKDGARALSDGNTKIEKILKNWHPALWYFKMAQIL